MESELIISIDRFRKLTATNSTFDDNFIWAMIERATDIVIQSYLGTALTEKLITDYNARTLTGLYSTMYNSKYCSIEKMVTWLAFQKGLPRMAYRVQNNGIGKSSGAMEGEVITTADLAILQNECEAYVVDYTNQVKTFLSQNFVNIPELKDTTLDYLKPNLTPSEARVGFGTTPNNYYNDIA